MRSHSAHGGPGTATTAHDPVFVGETRAKLDQLFALYPTKQACLLPALWMVQEERGWISEPAIGEVADVLDLTPAYVKGVVTFYTMYHTHPVGRHPGAFPNGRPVGNSRNDETRQAFTDKR